MADIEELKDRVEVIGNPEELYKLWDTICGQRDRNMIAEADYMGAKTLIFARIEFLKTMESLAS